MVYKITRSANVERDLEAIFDHLFETYTAFGDGPADAFQQAARRVRAIENDMEILAITPHQGTLLPRILQGLRSVTKNRAIFYFDVDDDLRQIRILAVFFGRQDHRLHIPKRILTEKRGSY